MFISVLSNISSTMRVIGIRANMKNKEMEQIVQQTFLSYIHRDVNAFEAAQAIQEAVGPIQGVKYMARKIALDISSNRYKISIRELNQRDYARIVNDLIPTFDLVARVNGGRTEAHISKTCSTKHHTDAYDRLVAQAAERYAIAV